MGKFVGFLMFVGLVWGFFAIKNKVERDEAEALAEAARAEADRIAAVEKAEADFLRDHPEAWKAREMVRLEHIRLGLQSQADQKTAGEEAARQNARNHAGMIVGIGRILRWW